MSLQEIESEYQRCRERLAWLQRQMNDETVVPDTKRRYDLLAHHYEGRLETLEYERQHARSH